MSSLFAHALTGLRHTRDILCYVFRIEQNRVVSAFEETKKCVETREYPPYIFTAPLTTKTHTHANFASSSRRTSIVPSIRIVAASIDGDLDDANLDHDLYRYGAVKMLELHYDTDTESSVSTPSR